jgi:hypothetical protein
VKVAVLVPACHASSKRSTRFRQTFIGTPRSRGCACFAVHYLFRGANVTLNCCVSACHSTLSVTADIANLQRRAKSGIAGPFANGGIARAGKAEFPRDSLRELFKPLHFRGHVGNESHPVGGVLKSGTMLHLEFALMQHLSKDVSLEMVGYHYQQMSGDSGAGERLGAFEGRVTAIGPALTWTWRAELRPSSWPRP